MERIDYEALVIGFLNSIGFDAFADVPDGTVQTKPEGFITVEQTGGSADGVAIGTVTLAVQSWARTRYLAAQLASRVDEAMFAIVDNSNPVTRIVRNGFYNHPTSQGEPRYQGVYEMTVHLYRN